MAARAVMAIVEGKGLHATEIGELIHLLRHVGHAALALGHELQIGMGL